MNKSEVKKFYGYYVLDCRACRGMRGKVNGLLKSNVGQRKKIFKAIK